MEIAIILSVNGQQMSPGKAIHEIALSSKQEDILVTLNGAKIVTKGTMFDGLEVTMLRQLVEGEANRRAMKPFLKLTGYLSVIMALTTIITSILH